MPYPRIITSSGAGGGLSNPTKVIYASSFGVTANTKVATAASWSNASAVITLGSGDPTFSAADVGKVIFGVTNNVQANGYINGTTAFSGTILSVQSATQCTISANTTLASMAAAASGFTGWVVWGTDDTAALQAAWAATKAANGQTLVLSAGMMMITSAPFINTTGSIYNNSIQGAGPAASSSVLVVSPTYNFAGATNAIVYYDSACNAAPRWTGSADQFDQNPFIYAGLRNFSVWGGGQDGRAVTNTIPIMVVSNAYCDNVWIVGLNWNLNNTKNTAPAWQVIGATLHNCGSWSAGNYGVAVTANAPRSAAPNHFINGLYGLTNGHALILSGSATLDSNGVKWATGGISTDPQSVQMTGGLWKSTNDQTTGIAASAGQADVVNHVNAFSGTDIWLLSSAARISAMNCEIHGLNISAGTFIDNGNNYTGAILPWTNGTITITGGTIIRTESITGQAATTGAFSLGAGWGNTAAVSAVSGNTKLIQFTVTAGGSGIAMNPTIVVTFPTPFAVAPICKLVQVAGTNFTDVTNAVSSSVSRTGATFTLGGTATTADTYTFQMTADIP